MRMVFGVLGLLIVVAIIGVVARNQLRPAPATAAATEAGVTVPTGTPKQQVDQVKQSVEKALQQSQPVVDDTK